MSDSLIIAGAPVSDVKTSTVVGDLSSPRSSQAALDTADSEHLTRRPIKCRGRRASRVVAVRATYRRNAMIDRWALPI